MAIVSPVLWLVWIALALIETKALKLPWKVQIAGVGFVVPLFLFCPPDRLVVVATAALAAGRAAMIALLWISRLAPEGLAISASLRSSMAIVAILIGAGAALLCGIRPAIPIVFAGYIIVRGVREYWYKRRGGIDTIALSLTLRAAELATILIGSLIT